MRTCAFGEESAGFFAIGVRFFAAARVSNNLNWSRSAGVRNAREIGGGLTFTLRRSETVTMITTTQRVLQWSPRILGTVVSLFIGLFALDAFGPGKPLADALLDFAIHLLPALILLTLVAASWRREWIGAFTFTGLAVVYATTMSRGRIDWMLLIAGPLLLVGILFLASWFNHRGHPEGV